MSFEQLHKIIYPFEDGTLNATVFIAHEKHECHDGSNDGEL